MRCGVYGGAAAAAAVDKVEEEKESGVGRSACVSGGVAMPTSCCRRWLCVCWVRACILAGSDL